MQHMPPYAAPAYNQGTTTVVLGGAAPYPVYPPKDHLVWSIFNTILLCPILGIIAIIFSVMTRKSKDEGKSTCAVV